MVRTVAEHGEQISAVKAQAANTGKKLDSLQSLAIKVLASSLASVALLLFNIVYHLAEKGALKGLIP
jgi:hypothetical protein